MARLNVVKSAQPRFKTVPVLDGEGKQVVTEVCKKDGTPKTNKQGRVVTRRLTKADPSQPLPNRACGKCRAEILPGDSYKWWANMLPGSRGSSKSIRCGKPECSPSQADMTPGRAGDLMRLQDDGHKQISEAESVEDLTGIAESLADQVQEMADELVQGADNIEDGFGHETQQSGELRERGEAMEGYAEELRDVDLDDEPDESEEDIRTNIEAENEDDEDADIDALVAEAWAEKREEFLEDQRDKVREQLDAVDIY